MHNTHALGTTARAEVPRFFLPRAAAVVALVERHARDGHADAARALPACRAHADEGRWLALLADAVRSERLAELARDHLAAAYWGAPSHVRARTRE